MDPYKARKIIQDYYDQESDQSVKDFMDLLLDETIILN
jgi:hypothetical protein